MTTRVFKLEQVNPNPYQPRLKDDQEYILKLAKSIALNTMLQLPTGRIDPESPDCVQLAFGHSRLAAHKLIIATSEADLVSWGKTFESSGQLTDFYAKYGEITINIADLTDEEMFQYAITENQDRKELTPVEEASAMRTYRDTFGKNSQEIGVLFHVSDSAVRNKMRLLDLPSCLQDQVGNTISEGTAREILVALDLPEPLKNEKQFSLDNTNYWSREFSIMEYIEAKVKKGETLLLTDVQDKVESLIRSNGTDLNQKLWKGDAVLCDENNKKLPSCKGCPLAVTKDKKTLCLNKNCFLAKTKAYQKEYLLKASMLTGIPLCDDDRSSYSDHTEFNYNDTHVLSSLRVKGGCENLRLLFDHNQYRGNDSESVTHLVKEGFPDAELICLKRNGFCTCIKAAKSRIEMAGQNGEALSEEDLKEVRRQIAEKKKNDRELIAQMISRTAELIGKAAFEGSLPAIRWIGMTTEYQVAEYWRKLDLAKVHSLEAAYPDIADIILKRSIYSEDPKVVLGTVNSALNACCLEPLDIQLDQESNPAGKTLAEVFAEEDAGNSGDNGTVGDAGNAIVEPQYVPVE